MRLVWSEGPVLSAAAHDLATRVGAGRDAAPFTTATVLSAWLDTVGTDRPVCVGTVFDGGEHAVGLLVLSHRPTDPPGRWRLWGDSVDIGSVFIEPGAEERCWGAWLADLPDGVDDLVLRNLPNVHRVTAGLHRAARAAGAPTDLVDHRAMSYADLAGGFGAWEESRSRSHRRQLRRSRARFAAVPGLGIEERWDADGAVAAVDELLALHDRRFGAMRRSSIYDALGERRLLRTLTGRLAAERGVLALVATSAGRPVAVDLTLTTPTTWYSFNGGWDPELSQYHLGTGLIVEAIERAAAAGARRFDLLDGEEPYKRRYASGSRRVGSWIVTNPAGRARTPEGTGSPAR